MSNKAPKNPLLVLLVLVNTIGALYLLQKQFSYQSEVDTAITKSKEGASPDSAKTLPHIPKAKAEHKIVEYPFGDFSVNLARPSGPQRFIKVTITLLVETPLKNDLTEIINKAPSLRDDIIALFNNQSPEEVLKLEGRSVLKNKIKEVINSALKDDEVLQVLFTKFMIS
ncbi:MAG: flagellar basal body-associated FliL family protein [Bdellovibrionota bacterium]|jgi:flagellar basal body-associated protein FliL|nr:flagellar basal body-associated FliL family protein [Bdellovibrionota bacterium]